STDSHSPKLLCSSELSSKTSCSTHKAAPTMETLESVLGEWLSIISIHQPLPGESVPLFHLMEPIQEFEAAVQSSEYYDLLNPPGWYPARNLLWLFSYFDTAI